MDPAALAGLCLLLARGDTSQTLPPGVVCPPESSSLALSPSMVASPRLRAEVGSAEARDAIGRVTFAEAGNQGDSGLAAVVYTILNRVQDGRWGRTVIDVVNAPSQFEPVMRAGGDWRRLPLVSAAAQARIDTILNLALDGRLPDLTHGARYFQNPAIVADRARAGQVGAGLVNFGGTAPSAVIGAHSFYVETRRGGGRSVGGPTGAIMGARRADAVMFVGENHLDQNDAAGVASTQSGTRSGDPSQALFVGADGRVSAKQP
jgi:N-acetylmuramoyl-L-alanine amidase